MLKFFHSMFSCRICFVERCHRQKELDPTTCYTFFELWRMKMNKMLAKCEPYTQNTHIILNMEYNMYYELAKTSVASIDITPNSQTMRMYLNLWYKRIPVLIRNRSTQQRTSAEHSSILFQVWIINKLEKPAWSDFWTVCLLVIR